MRILSSRWALVALAVLAALGFAFAVYGGHWWVYAGEGTRVEIGPFGSQRCFGGDCSSAGLAWVGASERWLRIGTATWAAALIAMLGLVTLAGGLAANRIPKMPAKFTLVACACATLAGSAFLVRFPGLAGSSLGRGPLLYALSIVVGALVAWRVFKLVPPPPPPE